MVGCTHLGAGERGCEPYRDGTWLETDLEPIVQGVFNSSDTARSMLADL